MEFILNSVEIYFLNSLKTKHSISSNSSLILFKLLTISSLNLILFLRSIP